MNDFWYHIENYQMCKDAENYNEEKKISHIESNVELKIIVQLVDKEIRNIVLTLLISKSWRK